MAASAWRLATALTTVLFAIARLLGLSDAQCIIQYENKPLLYGVEAQLVCPLASGLSPVKWWRSVEPCGGFSEYSSTGCTSSLCSIRTNNSYFYYCCTASTVSDVLTTRNEDRGCFRIQVCTDTSNNTQGLTIAFFNEPVQILIEMVSEPPPKQNTTIFLTDDSNSERLNTSVDKPIRVDGDARLIWQYIVHVLDLPSKPTEGTLRFTANFQHENTFCPTPDRIMYSIPVYRRSGTSIPTTPTANDKVTTEPETEGTSIPTTPTANDKVTTEPETEDNQETGVIVGVSIAGTTIIGIVVAAAIVGCVRYISMKLKGAEVSKKNEPQIPRYMKAGFYNATPESGDEGTESNFAFDDDDTILVTTEYQGEQKVDAHNIMDQDAVTFAGHETYSLGLTSPSHNERPFLPLKRNIKDKNSSARESVTNIAMYKQESDVDWHAGSFVVGNERPFIHAHQSTYFNIAEKTAEISFLGHHLLECDCESREYTNVGHDITLRIPEGAVTKGEKIHFEVGIAMYGPFIFPENMYPISPIIWLCLLEEDYELKKPYQLIFPHFLTELTNHSHTVSFAKANHKNYKVQNGQIYYEFSLYNTEPLFASSGYKNYGILTSKHCCFLCLLAKQTPKLALDAGYCLVRIESSLKSLRNEVYFSAVYFLDSCIQSLEEQFPREDGFQLSRYDTFKFNEETDPHIKMVVPSKHDQTECTIGIEPSTAMIRATDIDFWKFDFKNLKRRHERKMYPPRIKMTVSMRNPTSTLTLPIKFVGCSSDSQLDMELTFPFDSLLLSPLASSSASSGSLRESQSQMITVAGDKPMLRRVFKELYPLAPHWKSIGTLLGVPDHILDIIKKEEEGIHECLRKVLSQWLKQVDPPPTWKELIEAIETIDTQKALEMKQYCSV